MGHDPIPGSDIITGQIVDKAKLQRARELRRQMTPGEAILWKELRGNRLHGFHFRRQQIVHGFIVDFYCHQARLVLEIDGRVHYDQLDYDSARDDVLRAHGLRILRLTNQSILGNLPSALSTISEWLAVQSPPPPPLPFREGG